MGVGFWVVLVLFLLGMRVIEMWSARQIVLMLSSLFSLNRGPCLFIMMWSLRSRTSSYGIGQRSFLIQRSANTVADYMAQDAASLQQDYKE
ncbi:hypothetical protein PIB30_017066 [Stylosanthes scabra]|uniref:Uncharacterized protein n=1 Tax=Stylosanthes scabra TaxID=79078 RepID=A0ABU6S842_9FABA|nr:hypothetical protein [Stylosanthes scabra]